jgi:hypothetical protein
MAKRKSDEALIDVVAVIRHDTGHGILHIPVHSRMPFWVLDDSRVRAGTPDAKAMAIDKASRWLFEVVV